MHGLSFDDVHIERLIARPLAVPLVEPFVIATGRLDATRAVEVELEITWRGRRAVGLGEAACLPPVTREDRDDVLRELGGWARDIRALDELGPVARAGVETAVVDAMGRAAGVPVRELLGGDAGARTSTLETDITVAIASPPKMAELARGWVQRGFRALKVKVGKDVDADLRALEAIGRAAPGVTLRVDANAGYTARVAIEVARACERLGLAVECWEQPCAADDLDGMREVSAALAAPVVADESVRSLEDATSLADGGWADGANLKLAKLGGVLAAYRVGSLLKARGLRTMFGGMVETRLGMTAAAHVACALGGVDYVDLDTAWLLGDDPFEGGYVADGPRYTIPRAPGLGVTRR